MTWGCCPASLRKVVAPKSSLLGSENEQKEKVFTDEMWVKHWMSWQKSCLVSRLRGGAVEAKSYWGWGHRKTWMEFGEKVPSLRLSGTEVRDCGPDVTMRTSGMCKPLLEPQWAHWSEWPKGEGKPCWKALTSTKINCTISLKCDIKIVNHYLRPSRLQNIFETIIKASRDLGTLCQS